MKLQDLTSQLRDATEGRPLSLAAALCLAHVVDLRGYPVEAAVLMPLVPVAEARARDVEALLGPAFAANPSLPFLVECRRVAEQVEPHLRDERRAARREPARIGSRDLFAFEAEVRKEQAIRSIEAMRADEADAWLGGGGGRVSWWAHPEVDPVASESWRLLDVARVALREPAEEHRALFARTFRRLRRHDPELSRALRTLEARIARAISPTGPSRRRPSRNLPPTTPPPPRPAPSSAAETAPAPAPVLEVRRLAPFAGVERLLVTSTVRPLGARFSLRAVDRIDVIPLLLDAASLSPMATLPLTPEPGTELPWCCVADAPTEAVLEVQLHHEGALLASAKMGPVAIRPVSAGLHSTGALRFVASPPV